MIDSFTNALSYLKLTDLAVSDYQFLVGKNEKIPEGFLIQKLNKGIVLVDRINMVIYQLDYPFAEEKLEEVLNDMVGT